MNLIIMSLCTMCDSSRGVSFPTLWLFVESMGGTHKNQGSPWLCLVRENFFLSNLRVLQFNVVLQVGASNFNVSYGFWKFFVHGSRQLVPSVHSTI